MTALFLLHVIGCTLTTITAIAIWAALCLNTRTIGRSEDDDTANQPTPDRSLT